MTRGVLLIGNYPPPYGGVPRVIENLAPFLAELGWHVHVLSMGRSGIERRPGVTVYKLPLAAKLPLVLRHAVGLRRAPLGIRVRNRKDLVTRAWFRVLASVGREIIRQHRIDVICGFNLSRGGLVGAALGQERGIPLVVNNFGELLSNEAFFRSNPWLLPFVVGQARRLVSGSRHCAESYRRFGLSPAVEVIPYGVDTARFRPTVDGDAVRRRMGAGPEEVVVLYLGRLVRDMGLHTLLAAAPALLGGAVPIRLVIAGAAGDLSADAHALAERSAGRVVVLENVPNDRLPALYAASDLVVVPTIGDRACSSLAAAEGLATGRPVVATRIGGIPEVVRDGETGVLIPPDDARSLGDAVAALAADPSRRRSLGERGRAWTEAAWDTRIVLGRMADVLAGSARDPA